LTFGFFSGDIDIWLIVLWRDNEELDSFSVFEDKKRLELDRLIRLIGAALKEFLFGRDGGSAVFKLEVDELVVLLDGKDGGIC
jgi:hypothetical protein